jgi:hypothetical protein
LSCEWLENDDNDATARAPPPPASSTSRSRSARLTRRSSSSFPLFEDEFVVLSAGADGVVAGPMPIRRLAVCPADRTARLHLPGGHRQCAVVERPSSRSTCSARTTTPRAGDWSERAWVTPCCPSWPSTSRTPVCRRQVASSRRWRVAPSGSPWRSGRTTAAAAVERVSSSWPTTCGAELAAVPAVGGVERAASSPAGDRRGADAGRRNVDRRASTARRRPGVGHRTAASPRPRAPPAGRDPRPRREPGCASPAAASPAAASPAAGAAAVAGNARHHRRRRGDDDRDSPRADDRRCSVRSRHDRRGRGPSSGGRSAHRHADTVVVVDERGARCPRSERTTGWSCQRGGQVAMVGRAGYAPRWPTGASGDGTAPAGVFPPRYDHGVGRPGVPVLRNGADPGVRGAYRPVQQGDCWGATPGRATYNHLFRSSSGRARRRMSTCRPSPGHTYTRPSSAPTTSPRCPGTAPASHRSPLRSSCTATRSPLAVR